MSVEGIDGYVIDLATGVAVWVRSVIDTDDQRVKLFTKDHGACIGQNTIVAVAKHAVVCDLQGEARYHVEAYVRRACMRARGTLPKAPEAAAPTRHCIDCGEPQAETRSGWVCANGHGGAPNKEGLL